MYDDGAAYAHTRTVRVHWGDRDVRDIGALLRSAGLAHVADHRTRVVGLGVVHHTWVADGDEWTRLLGRIAAHDDLVSPIAVDVFEQAFQRHHEPAAGATLAADTLAVPLALVRELLRDPGLTDRTGWPTLAGLGAVRAGVARAVPADAVRAERDELRLLARLDGGFEHHIPVTGPAPSGARRVRIPRPRSLAALVLASTGSGDDDSAAARLALRLDALAEASTADARGPVRRPRTRRAASGRVVEVGAVRRRRR